MIHDKIRALTLEALDLHVAGLEAMAEGPSKVPAVNDAITRLRAIESTLRAIESHAREGAGWVQRRREHLEADPRLLQNQLAASIAQAVTK